LFILLCTLSTSPASAGIEIPAGASDSQVCSLIDQEHKRGLDLWRNSRLADALAAFQACEDALKKRALWMPPKLPAEAPPDRRRAWTVTNSVIFSLAAIHQRMGRRAESERYADMARERGLIPKIYMAPGPRQAR